MDVLWLLIRNRHFTRFTFVTQLSSPLHFLHVIKYTTLDDLHGNDPGLKIDVVSGIVKEDLVSIKLHIWHVLYQISNFHLMLTLLWIRMRLSLGVIAYMQ